MIEPVRAPVEVPILITVEEAARRLAIGRTLVYQLLYTGELPSLRIGRCRRIRVGDLEAFLEQQASSSLESDCGY